MFPLFVDIYVKIFFNVVHVQEHAPCILYYLATFIIRKVFFIKPISYKIYGFILDNMRITWKNQYTPKLYISHKSPELQHPFPDMTRV